MSSFTDFKQLLWSLLACAILTNAFTVRAGVAISLNLGTEWVGTPTIMVANHPSVNVNSAEGNWGSGAPYSLGQSFVATVSGTLTNIQLYMTGHNTTNTLFLYDMGPAMQYLVSQPAVVAPGSNGIGNNLFSTNLTVAVGNMANPNVVRLQFSGPDTVQLIGGHQYLFNLTSANTGNQTYWHRDGGGSDIYSGGTAYRQNALLNGSKTTDFSLAVSLVDTSAPSAIYNLNVDWNSVYQRVDGFGASSAWRSDWTVAQADMFFSTNSGSGVSLDGKTNFAFSGIGLSMLRSRIVPGGTTWENSLMQMAQARGARVWSAPWSPDGKFKNSTNWNGGNFVSANNQAYAAQLAGYVVSMSNTYGVNIYALSVQNEPDVSASYESCLWTAQQIHDFIPYLHDALVASNKASTKIIAGEDEHWQTNYYGAAMSDPAVATNVAIVACHNYDGSPPNNVPTALPMYANTNASLWETEVSKLSGNGAFDGSMTDAMYWAGRIHSFMTVAQVNGWHYWWLISNNPDNEGLTDQNGIPAKRMYVLGQYSRFVRPDYFRINEGNNNPYAVSVTAYKDPASRNFAIVVANSGATDTNQTFYITNFNAAAVTPWITSSTLSLVAQTPVAVTNSTFSYVIPAMSVVTFAGVANPAPTAILLSSNSVLEAQPAGIPVGTFNTTVASPGDTFAYALAAGDGSTDNASFAITNNILYAGISFNFLAKNSYSIRVQSTSLSGTVAQTFVITVIQQPANLPPSSPTNSVPVDGAVNQPLTPSLAGSTFIDPGADTHTASEWLVRRSSDSAVVFDSGTNSTDLEVLTLPPATLDYATGYSWQVRYQDSHGGWSSFSTATVFSTSAPGLALNSQSGGTVNLSWPTNAGGYQLEYTPVLPATNWILAPASAVIMGDQNVFTDPMTNSAGFYRLSKTP